MQLVIAVDGWTESNRPIRICEGLSLRLYRPRFEASNPSRYRLLLMALQLAPAVSKNGAPASAKLFRATQSNFEKESPMANETDSIERIAADILIATIQAAHNQTAHNLLDKPEDIAEQFKTVHAAVKTAFEDRQKF